MLHPIQLYTILTNEQMAKIDEKRIVNVEELKKISGIGDQRIKKYGKDIINVMKNIFKNR